MAALLEFVPQCSFVLGKRCRVQFFSFFCWASRWLSLIHIRGQERESTNNVMGWKCFQVFLTQTWKKNNYYSVFFLSPSPEHTRSWWLCSHSTKYSEKYSSWESPDNPRKQPLWKCFIDGFIEFWWQKWTWGAANEKFKRWDLKMVKKDYLHSI